MKDLSPFARSELITKIANFIYQPTYNRMQDELKVIILKNSELHKNRQKAFLYLGECYTCADLRYFVEVMNPLHKDLRKEFKEWLAHKDQVTIEFSYIQSFILRAINFADSKEALLAITPSVIHSYIKDTIFFPTRIHESSLSDEEIDKFIEANQSSITTIKKRLTMNLIEG